MTYKVQQPGIVDIAEAMVELKEKDVSFDQAIILLISTHGLTWGAARDRLEGAEMISGVRLDR